ncbi:MAG: hypothetical protein ACK4UN_14840, partial [Limisphaerales bacterium]
MFKPITLLTTIVATLLASDILADSRAEFGPFFHQFHLTLAPGERTEVAGPLFYLEDTEDYRLWGVPPLFSHIHRPQLDVTEIDV